VPKYSKPLTPLLTIKIALSSNVSLSKAYPCFRNCSPLPKRTVGESDASV